MPNPYEPSESKSQPHRRLDLWRWMTAAPLVLLGSFWCLLFIRMPDRLAEAWTRSHDGGWESVLQDAAFAESLWRCTMLPLTGAGLLCQGIGLIQRSRLLMVAGLILEGAAFFGTAFLR